MSTHGKKYTTVKAKVAVEKSYDLKDAVTFLQANKFAKFDETAELAFRLGVDPTQSDQNVRGTVMLPNGSGKKVRVLVFATGAAADAAKAAGADYVGYEDLVAKVQGGWADFDVAVATNETMKEVRKLGKVLGPRGLMPNPKTGTVTVDVVKAIKEIKAGKVEFRVDKTGIIHAPVGKVSFSAEKLVENAASLISAVIKAKPAVAKGKYVKSATVCSTMGPGVKIDTTPFSMKVAL